MYDTTAREVPAGTTTPSPVDLAEMMAEAVQAGAACLVMEVSSHALDQHRTDGIELDVAVFTNLTGDHLDYHGTMESYLAAKRRLFESLPAAAAAVLNRDDPHADAVAAATAARKLWYGLSPAAEVCARIESIDATGSRFGLRHGGREVPVRTSLIGRHNVVNCVAAAAAATALGLELEAIAGALGEVGCVPGRLERVAVAAPFDVLVDYAHTDDALQNVLSALLPIKKGRLILVFGCGGDRDRSKRPRMARVAESAADHIIVTSDNPRSEDPMAIIQEIMTGFSERGRQRVLIQPDRRQAIAAALQAASDGDIVLIAGKGHENYQSIGGRRIHFDDVETAEELLRAGKIWYNSSP
jgi:UDP-N-acetylmuramoyl-L-alanyl-D-glutamate--2,6-diaminopimelate ligase